jgi:hypothetical protein
MGDKNGKTAAGHTKADQSTNIASPTKGADNGEPVKSNSGLDAQGQMRIGERITIAVRGGNILLMQSHSGREVEVSEETLAGLLDDEYFVEHRD